MAAVAAIAVVVGLVIERDKERLLNRTTPLPFVTALLLFWSTHSAPICSRL